ncbi:MAG: tryptophan synthase subunit alpha [Candidatus Omnitrophica bacterium]|nr:tryptophan synthase subunit alpha [Candidatus Omnitrophota bacterium]
MNRIDLKFKNLKKDGRKAFIAFITAGYPDLETTYHLVLELEKNGVDIVELGVPFSDPLADGPVIQEASVYALKRGVNLPKILDLVKRLRRKTEIPICLMTYYNPVFCFGEKVFVDKAVDAGVDGVIIPDLSYEEAGNLRSCTRHKDLANICFIAPTSSPERMRKVLNSARGFVYYVSLTGVTGSRKRLPADLKSKLTEVRRVSPCPVCVGFGISSASQVEAVGKFSDGVIVGSAIVARIRENIGRSGLVKNVGAFTGRLNAKKI